MTVKVLIVDDEAPMRRMMSRTLAGKGYECHAVESAETARRSLANAKVDLLISDIRMPKESGLDLIRSIIGKYPQMAIMLASGLDNGNVIESAIEIGVDGYITKPFENNQLLVSIELALSHRRMFFELDETRRGLERRVDERTWKLTESIKNLSAARHESDKSKALFKGLFKNAQVGIAIGQKDPQGQDVVFVDINPTAEDILGKPRHDVLHRSIREVFPEREHLGLLDWVCTVSQTGRTEHRLIPIVKEDNTLWWQFCIFSLPTGEVVAFIMDETERIQAEHKLRDQVNFIQNLIESIPNPMFYKGADGRYQGCNSAFAKLMDLPREAIVGLTTEELWPEDLAQVYMAADREIFHQGGSLQMETQIEKADGDRRDIILSKRSYYNDDGRIAGVVGVMVDITARTEAEAILKESEAEFRAIAESAQDAIIKIDNKGCITYWNQAAESIFGYSTKEAIGQDMHALLAPTHYQAAIRNALTRFNHTGCGNFIGKLVEVTARTKSGNEFPAELSMASVHLRGAWHAIGIVRNISERKKMEEKLLAKHRKLKAIRADLETQNVHLAKMHAELKQAQQQTVQQEKMASIGQLAAGVAHEINNPTGFVSSNLKSLQDYLEDLFKLLNAYGELRSALEASPTKETDAPPTAEQLAEIKRIESDIDLAFLMSDTIDLIRESREGTERIKKIVIDLKDFAHPGQHERMTSDINRNLESVLNIVWNELKYKATVSKDLGDLPPVECYPQQLNQVFMNLLVNAGHAIDNMGEIHIATRNTGDGVEIEIRDTGCGIPAENLKRIFDPFFTTKPVGKGTGLGLNVAYNIVKKHGGEINAASRPGEGTTFTIRLPLELPVSDPTDENMTDGDAGEPHVRQAS